MPIKKAVFITAFLFAKKALIRALYTSIYYQNINVDISIPSENTKDTATTKMYTIRVALAHELFTALSR